MESFNDQNKNSKMLSLSVFYECLPLACYSELRVVVECVDFDDVEPTFSGAGAHAFCLSVIPTAK